MDEVLDSVVNPNYYKGFSNGSEVIDITENLTFNGGNVVKYVARSTRLDGETKPSTFEDKLVNLEKARWYLDREIQLLKKRQEQFQWKMPQHHLHEAETSNEF